MRSKKEQRINISNYAVLKASSSVLKNKERVFGMKKWSNKSFVAGILSSFWVIFLIGTAAATVASQTVQLDYTDIKITMDGKIVEPKDAAGNYVEPFAINGTTYLPVRAIANALGLDVGWNGATKTVSLNTPEEEHPIYITQYGKKYHYDPNCNGGTYWEAPLKSALGMGLTPCDKCIK